MPQRLVKVFELAELDRPLVAGMRDGAAEKPQRHFRGKIGELRRRQSDRAPHRPRAGRQRRARGRDRKFDGGFRAPHARRQPRQTPRIETLARQMPASGRATARA